MKKNLLLVNTIFDSQDRKKWSTKDTRNKRYLLLV